MKDQRKFVCQRADYLNKDDFIKSLRRLRQSGGPKQKAAEKVTQIIGNVELGTQELFKLTNHGETRIEHCVKYDLPGACRLVTVQNDNVVWFLFVGDHEEADRWLESHKGLQLAASKDDKRIRQTRVGVPQVASVELQQTGIITDENKPFLARFPFPEFETLIPQAKLRRDLYSIKEETDAETILETIELIGDGSVRELVFDLIAAAKDGRYDEAEMRLKIHRQEAESIIENHGLLDAALESGENSDSVLSFNDLPAEELARLLDSARFEDWMLFLHPEQKRIVEADFDMPAVLKGVSGSGKTVVLIHRARRLAQKYSGENVAILTLNRTLANLLKNLVARLCNGKVPENLYVDAYYDYFQKILRHFGAEDYLQAFVNHLTPNHPMGATFQQALKYHHDLANEFSPRGKEDLEDTWREYWRDELAKDASAAAQKALLIDAIRGEFDEESYIRDEFTLVRSAFPAGVRSGQSGPNYYTFERKGRCINFPEKARKSVLRLLMRYEEYMLAGAMLDEMGLAQALFPSIKKFPELPSDLQRRCLLIDEFQDFSTLELRLLKQIPTSQENGLFLTGDTVQKVLVKDFNLGNAALDRNYVRTRTIRKNYRNSRQILEAADALIQKYGEMAAKADDSIERLKPELAVRETARPIALKTNHAIEAAWQTAHDWVVEAQNPPWSVCLVSANSHLLSIEKILTKKPFDLKAEELSGDYINRKDTISVGALSDVKGLEFSLIIIVDCSKETLPSPQIPAGEQWRDAMRLYVAMTRGRDQVVMTYEGEPSEFLTAMEPFLVWDEVEVAEAAQPVLPARAPGPTPVPRYELPKPKPTAGKTAFEVPASIDVILRNYFERQIYKGTSRSIGRMSSGRFRDAYLRWRRPENVNGVRVSELFVNREFRRDLAEDIDKALHPFGFRLKWDK